MKHKEMWLGKYCEHCDKTGFYKCYCLPEPPPKKLYEVEIKYLGYVVAESEAEAEMVFLNNTNMEHAHAKVANQVEGWQKDLIPNGLNLADEDMTCQEYLEKLNFEGWGDNALSQL